MKKNKFLSEVMSLAWQFVKKNGYSISEALKCAWANIKLRAAMSAKIVKFYFKKIDGSTREAFGTLNEKFFGYLPKNDNRTKKDTVQVYYDTEKQEFRCFKKANLINVAI